MPDSTKRDNGAAPYDDKLPAILRHKAFKRFIKLRGQPREIALGFALGIFIGMSPTYGLQIALGVFLAALFKWNKFSAVVGVWISNPITAPFIYGSTYYLGASILGIDSSFSAENMFSVSFVTEFIKNTPLIFAALMMGGILVGAPLAAISYFVSYAILKRYQKSVKQALGKQKTKLAKIKHLKQKHKKDSAINVKVPSSLPFFQKKERR